jgi:hypothetical protein
MENSIMSHILALLIYVVPVLAVSNVTRRPGKTSSVRKFRIWIAPLGLNMIFLQKVHHLWKSSDSTGINVPVNKTPVELFGRDLCSMSTNSTIETVMEGPTRQIVS